MCNCSSSATESVGNYFSGAPKIKRSSSLNLLLDADVHNVLGLKTYSKMTFNLTRPVCHPELLQCDKGCCDYTHSTEPQASQCELITPKYVFYLLCLPTVGVLVCVCVRFHPNYWRLV